MFEDPSSDNPSPPNWLQSRSKSPKEYTYSVTTTPVTTAEFVDLYVLQPGNSPTDPNSTEDAPGATVVQNVADFVRVVQARCRHQGLRHLRIGSHGSPEHFRIGNDRIREDNLSTYQTDLEKITPYFIPQKSLVTIDACKSGHATGLLKKLSAIWGVPVKGFRYNQKTERIAAGGDGPTDEGPYHACGPDACDMGDSEFDHSVHAFEEYIASAAKPFVNFVKMF